MHNRELPDNDPAHSDQFARVAEASRARRRAGVHALPRILHDQHPQPAHTPGLCSRRAYARAAEEFLAWCAAAGVPVDRRRPAGARRDLDRSRHARARGAGKSPS